MSEETRNIVPRKDGEAGIGREDKYWGKGYFNSIHIKNDVVIAGKTLKDTFAEKDKNLSDEITKVNAHFTTNEDAIRTNTDNIAKNTKSITINTENIASLSKDVNSFKANVGAPFVAATVANMTDTNKIYVYTGNEAGYTKGNWYYNNGTKWVSGGIYNSNAVETDKTLSISGMAADSEVCGETFSALNDKVDISNNIQYPTFSDVDGYLEDDGDVITDQSSWKHSSPIKVDAYKTVVYKGKGYNQSVGMISITDAEGKHYQVKAVSKDSTFRIYTFHTNTPCYISITYNINDKSQMQLFIVNDTESKVNNLYSKLEYAETDIDVGIGIDNAYVYKTGEIAPHEKWAITEPFTCEINDIIQIRCKGYDYAAIISEVKNGTYIPKVIAISRFVETYTYLVTEPGTFVVSYEKAYPLHICKISLLSNSFHNILNYKNNNNKWAYNMWKILCIGDSLTSGAAYREGMHYPGSSIDQNYPRMLGRMLNAEVTNGGYSGYSASDWFKSSLPKYDFSKYDTFIIWLGTNKGLTDTLDEDVNAYENPDNYKETETGYYCRIIEAIKKANKDCLIVLTKVFTASSAGGANITNIAIDKIAKKYGLLVIDNSDLAPKNRPELHAGINNVHFGKAGNALIADRYIQKISEWIDEYPLRSEFGYTARTN